MEEEQAVTKRALIEAMAAQYPRYTKRELAWIVEHVFQTLTDALAQGDRVELRGFGSFQVTYRAARAGRNPRTGAVVAVPAKRVPVFKVGKDLQRRVNGKGKGEA